MDFVVILSSTPGAVTFHVYLIKDKTTGGQVLTWFKRQINLFRNTRKR